MLFYDYIYKYINIYIAIGSRFDISTVDLRFRQSIWDFGSRFEIMAVDLRDFVGFWILGPNITNESTPGILTNHFCYHKINERAISLVFLSIRQFGHTLYTKNLTCFISLNAVNIFIIYIYIYNPNMLFLYHFAVCITFFLLILSIFSIYCFCWHFCKYK